MPATGRSFSRRDETQQEQTEVTRRFSVSSFFFAVFCSISSLDSAFFEFLRKERIGQRGHICRLFVICCATMAAFDILVVEDIVALLFHPGDHFAGVSRMNAIVTS